MQKPDPRGCCGNPGIFLKCAHGRKRLKGLPRATHCTDRAQTSGTVTAWVELCPPHPTVRTKVRARKDVPEETKTTMIRTHIYIYICIYIYKQPSGILMGASPAPDLVQGDGPTFEQIIKKDWNISGGIYPVYV